MSNLPSISTYPIQLHGEFLSTWFNASNARRKSSRTGKPLFWGNGGNYFINTSWSLAIKLSEKFGNPIKKDWMFR